MGILGTAQMEAWYQKLLLSLNIIGPEEMKFLLAFSPAPFKTIWVHTVSTCFCPSANLQSKHWGKCVLGEDRLTCPLEVNGMDPEGFGEV